MQTIPSPSRFRPNPLLAAALAIAALSLSAALPGRAEDPAPRRLTPAQETRMFPERKTALLRHQRQRIKAMQSTERCINGAGDNGALRSCMEEARQANQAERKSHREVMREIYARNGISAPMDRQGGGGGKGRRGT